MCTVESRLWTCHPPHPENSEPPEHSLHSLCNTEDKFKATTDILVKIYFIQHKFHWQINIIFSHTDIYMLNSQVKFCMGIFQLIDN